MKTSTDWLHAHTNRQNFSLQGINNSKVLLANEPLLMDTGGAGPRRKAVMKAYKKEDVSQRPEILTSVLISGYPLSTALNFQSFQFDTRIF